MIDEEACFFINYFINLVEAIQNCGDIRFYWMLILVALGWFRESHVVLWEACSERLPLNLKLKEVSILCLVMLFLLSLQGFY